MCCRCPECSHGDLDLNHNGDGRWKIEWYAVPCPVGDTNLRYDIVVSSQYWFSLVISNTRSASCNPCLHLAISDGPFRKLILFLPSEKLLQESAHHTRNVTIYRELAPLFSASVAASNRAQMSLIA